MKVITISEIPCSAPGDSMGRHASSGGCHAGLDDGRLAAKGAASAVNAWSTIGDDRIERLIDETLGRGYFALDELRPHARKRVSARINRTPVKALREPMSGAGRGTITIASWIAGPK